MAQVPQTAEADVHGDDNNIGMTHDVIPPIRIALAQARVHGECLLITTEAQSTYEPKCPPLYLGGERPAGDVISLLDIVEMANKRHYNCRKGTAKT